MSKELKRSGKRILAARTGATDWVPGEPAVSTGPGREGRVRVAADVTAEAKSSRKAALWEALEAVALIGAAGGGVATLATEVVAVSAVPAMLPILALFASRRAQVHRRREEEVRWSKLRQEIARLLERMANEDTWKEVAERAAQPQAEAAAKEVREALSGVGDMGSRLGKVEQEVKNLGVQSEQAAREAGQAAGKLARDVAEARAAAEESLQSSQGLPARLDAVERTLDQNLRGTVREELRAPMAAVPQLVAALNNAGVKEQANGDGNLERVVYGAAEDAVSAALSGTAVSELGGLAEKVSSLSAKVEEQKAGIDSLRRSVSERIEAALSAIAEADPPPQLPSGNALPPEDDHWSEQNGIDKHGEREHYDTYEERMETGLSLLRQGRREQTSEKIERAVEVFESLVSNEATRTPASLGNCGNALLALARRRASEGWSEENEAELREAEALLVEAGRKFSEVLRLDGSDGRAACNWGHALSLRAQIMSRAGRGDDAERLFEAALEKYGACDGSVGPTLGSLLGAGDCLLELANLRRGKSSEESLLARARRRFARALDLDGTNSAAQTGLRRCDDALAEIRQPST